MCGKFLKRRQITRRVGGGGGGGNGKGRRIQRLKHFHAFSKWVEGFNGMGRVEEDVYGAMCVGVNLGRGGAAGSRRTVRWMLWKCPFCCQEILE
jgi:hypothetical protein